MTSTFTTVMKYISEEVSDTNFKLASGLDFFPNSQCIFSEIFHQESPWTTVDIYVNFDQQVVYSIMVEFNGKVYVWVDPQYEDEFKDWRHFYPNDIYLSQENVLDKLEQVCKNEPFDTRVDMEVNFTDEEFNMIAMAAHKRDMTINKYIEEVLQMFINEYKE